MPPSDPNVPVLQLNERTTWSTGLLVTIAGMGLTILGVSAGITGEVMA